METIKIATHVAHDLAMSIWFGGNVFGIAALNPAASKATLPADRGAVVNQAWENFIPLGLGSAVTLGATWVGMRLTDPRMESPELRAVTRIHDLAVGSTVALTLIGGIFNRMTAESAPGDRTQMEDGLTPAEGAPAQAKQGLMGLRVVAVGNLVAGTALMSSAAILEQMLMDAGPRSPAYALKGAKAIAGDKADKAMTVASGLAATELVRRGLRMIAEGLGRAEPEPEPRSRWQQIGDQARGIFAGAR